ncbi:hypothetical protein C8R44DRAFT_751423 [Mycena epipterygia]|nr:hypothetical protein C8R44DRAFT_751423 [Mycena epipterygia]
MTQRRVEGLYTFLRTQTNERHAKLGHVASVSGHPSSHPDHITETDTTCPNLAHVFHRFERVGRYIDLPPSFESFTEGKWYRTQNSSEWARTRIEEIIYIFGSITRSNPTTRAPPQRQRPPVARAHANLAFHSDTTPACTHPATHATSAYALPHDTTESQCRRAALARGLEVVIARERSDTQESGLPVHVNRGEYGLHGKARRLRARVPAYQDSQHPQDGITPHATSHLPARRTPAPARTRTTAVQTRSASHRTTPTQHRTPPHGWAQNGEAERRTKEDRRHAKASHA